MRSVRALSGGVLLVALLWASGMRTAPAKVQQIGFPGQQQQPPGGLPSTTPGRTHSTPDDEMSDPMKDRMEAERAKMQVADRRKRLVDDTTKLLALATELKAEVDKTSKDEMSLTVIKKAGDIEKLAHDVKERMKG